MSGIEHVVKPGVVRIDCGCSPDRRRKCLQRGPGRNDDGQIATTLNEGCHVFVTEDELLEMAATITKARFASTKREEAPAPDLDIDHPIPALLKRNRALANARKKKRKSARRKKK